MTALNLHNSLVQIAIADVARFSPIWTEHMVRASLQGGALIGVVWIACRCLPKLPAAVKQWLWALVSLKLIVTLFWVNPIAVPVLKSAPILPSPDIAVIFTHTHFTAPALVSTVPPSAAATNFGVAADPAITSPINAGTAPSRGASPYRMLPLMPAVLFVVYAACSIVILLRYAVRAWRLALVVRGSASVADEPTMALIDKTARSAGLRLAPAVRVSAEICGPLVCGLWSPIVLLPTSCGAPTVVPDANGGQLSSRIASDPVRLQGDCACLLGAWDREDLRLALAHEMTHIKRGDIALTLIPSFARLLFWFHPLAWLAHSEYGAATEEACDGATIRAMGASPVAYFQLLLRVAEFGMRGGASRPAAAATLGLSTGFQLLHRRLDNLSRLGSGQLSKAICAAAVLLTLVCLGLMAPLQFTARVRAWISSTLPAYAIGDLGLVSGRSSAAGAINNDGVVVGELLPSRSRGPGQALLWRDGSLATIGSPAAYRHCVASGINDSGMVIASSYNYGPYHHAFRWGNGVQRLGSLPGFRFSKAYGINNAGSVVGVAQAGRPRWGQSAARAYLWSDGRMQDLGTLGGAYSCAYSIDGRGDVVGKADMPHSLFTGDSTHAFYWRNQAMTDLGTLGGPDSVAYALIDTGVIAGAADLDDSVRHACLWYRGQISDLGALTPGASSEARAINREGEVVGMSTVAAGSITSHAVLWWNGHLIDLNSLLPAGSAWTLEQARGINDHGQIVGVGRLHGKTQAFILNPSSSGTKASHPAT